MLARQINTIYCSLCGVAIADGGQLSASSPGTFLCAAHELRKREMMRFGIYVAAICCAVNVNLITSIELAVP